MFYILCFALPDPQGREIAKYGDFRPFWPRTAFGTQRNHGRGLKTEKTRFPGARGPKIEKKMSPRCPGWFPATFSGITSFRSDPHRSETVIWWYFGLFWAAGTEENSGTGPKTEKRNFPAPGVLKSKTKVTTLSSMVVGNLFTFYVLPDRTPRGGKLRNTGILGHFGLGRPSALREITGAG